MRAVLGVPQKLGDNADPDGLLHHSCPQGCPVLAPDYGSQEDPLTASVTTNIDLFFIILEAGMQTIHKMFARLLLP